MFSLRHCLLIAIQEHPSCPVYSLENQFQDPTFDLNLDYFPNVLQKFCVETDLPFYFCTYRNNVDAWLKYK